MVVDPQMADTFWIVGLIMLGLMIVFKFVNRKSFEEKRFERRVGARPDPSKMPDTRKTLPRVRLQLIAAAISIAALTFIAIMGMGEDPRGIPLPTGLFDVFR